MNYDGTLKNDSIGKLRHCTLNYEMGRADGVRSTPVTWFAFRLPSWRWRGTHQSPDWIISHQFRSGRSRIARDRKEEQTGRGNNPSCYPRPPLPRWIMSIWCISVACHFVFSVAGSLNSRLTVKNIDCQQMFFGKRNVRLHVNLL